MSRGLTAPDASPDPQHDSIVNRVQERSGLWETHSRGSTEQGRAVIPRRKARGAPSQQRQNGEQATFTDEETSIPTTDRLLMLQGPQGNPRVESRSTAAFESGIKQIKDPENASVPMAQTPQIIARQRRQHVERQSVFWPIRSTRRCLARDRASNNKIYRNR